MPARVRKGEAARLPPDPTVAAPISAARVLTECVVLARTPVPLILVNRHMGLWRVVIGGVGMPTNAFAVADNFGGRTHR
jgi:hypothetical protein